MRLLLKYGVESDDADVRRAALRCVANALLLEKKMRQIFVDSGYSGKLAEHLEVPLSKELAWETMLTVNGDRVIALKMS